MTGSPRVIAAAVGGLVLLFQLPAARGQSVCPARGDGWRRSPPDRSAASSRTSAARRSRGDGFSPRRQDGHRRDRSGRPVRAPHAVTRAILVRAHVTGYVGSRGQTRRSPGAARAPCLPSPFDARARDPRPRRPRVPRRRSRAGRRHGGQLSAPEAIEATGSNGRATPPADGARPSGRFRRRPVRRRPQRNGMAPSASAPRHPQGHDDAGCASGRWTTRQPERTRPIVRRLVAPTCLPASRSPVR